MGREGALRAKRWLDATTRVDVTWLNPDAAYKLTFEWHDSGKFSFDLGGLMRGGEIEGKEFFAEIKKYSDVGGQPAMYTEYLAKCYRAYSLRPERCDHFIWLTWHPFSLNKWSRLCTASEVRSAVLEHCGKCLGEDDPQLAAALVDDETCAVVADRLWLIVLSDKQETLVIEDDDRDAILALQRRRRG